MTILEDFKTSIIQVSNNIKNYIDAVVPKKVSELENDVGFLHEHQDISGKANTSDLAVVATTGSYDDLTNQPSIPTKTTDIENDSGFITSSDLDDIDLTGCLKDTDVKDNLISTDTDKPLSANQGRLLKLMDEEPMILEVTGNSFEEYNDSTALQGNNIVVDYGDGTIEPLGTRLQHSYTDEINNHTVKIYGVTSLGESCFKRCTSLTSIIIPNNVTSLGESCFEQSKGLTSITIPNSVTSLEDFCFKNCEGLLSITIPDSITSLGSSCFSVCTGLTSITLPNSITSIGNYCFNSCTGLTDYYLNWINIPITWNSNMMPNNTNTIFHIPYETTALYEAKQFPSDKLQEYIKTSEETTDSIIDNDLRPVTSNAVNDALNTKASTTTATSTTNGLMSSTDKSKLDDMTTVALEVTYADGSPSETLYIIKRSGGS